MAKGAGNPLPKGEGRVRGRPFDQFRERSSRGQVQASEFPSEHLTPAPLLPERGSPRLTPVRRKPHPPSRYFTKPSPASPTGSAFNPSGFLPAAAGAVGKVTLRFAGSGFSDQLPSASGLIVFFSRM